PLYEFFSGLIGSRPTEAVLLATYLKAPKVNRPPDPVETPKADPKTELKAETKPETKAEVKPDAKVEVKPETKPEVKPAPNPKPALIHRAGLKPEPKRVGPPTPVPDPAALAKAEKVIRELYKDDYARSKPAELAALSTKLLQQFAETKDDPAAQYVLLTES